MKKFVTLLLLAGSTVLLAQEKKHTVEAKETIYGISKKYEISQEDLYNANPLLEKNGLKIGDVIIIPSSNKQKSNDKPTNTETTTPTIEEDENFIYLTIKPKDNVYQITKTYNVSESTLKSLNPVQLENGLKVGDVIRLPKAKSSKPTPVSTPEGSYLVGKNETLYSLSKKLEVSVDDLYAENPNLQLTGLKDGMYIKVPKKSGRSVIEDDTINYTVQTDDSVYGIINRYDITLEKLIELNPTIIDGLKTGMVLKLPLQEKAKIIKYSEPGKIKRVNDNEINIALMLPFNADNAASLKNNQSTQFLTGAKIALNRLTKDGKNINFKVIDTKNENDLESILATNDLSKYDAIIGPIKPGAVIEVAEFIKGSGIGLVSPYANTEDLNNYDNLFISNPREEVLADLIIDDIKNNFDGEQIYLLADNSHQDLADYTKTNLEKQLKANVVIVNNANKIIQPSDKVKDVEYFTPIIAVMIGDNNNLGEQFLNRLKTFNKDNVKAYGIKPVDIYDIYNTDNAKNIDAFREFGFVYSTAHIMNTRDAETQNILKDFNDAFCEVPNKNEQLGYDVVYDIIDRMNSKGDFLNNVTSENTRLAYKFAYKRVGSKKAFANDSARLIRLPKK